MATSQLLFFKNDFPDDVPVLVDDLVQYLTSLSASRKLLVNDFMYQRHALDKEIVLAKSQTYSESFDFNYCEIINSTDNKPFFYFITNVQQVAPGSLRITLRMDTVNSLAINNEYCHPSHFNENTQIVREHKDRFVKPTHWNKYTAGTLQKKIDPVSEGIAVNKFKVADDKLLDTDDIDWYLIYKNHTEVDPENPTAAIPVDTFLCASEDITIGVPSSGASIEITPADLEVGKFYYFTILDNPNGAGQIKAVGGTLTNFALGSTASRYIGGVGPNKETDSAILKSLVIKKDSSTRLSIAWGYDIAGVYYTNFGLGNETPYGSMFTGSAVQNEPFGVQVLSVKFTQANFMRVSSADYVVSEPQTPEGLKYLIDTKMNIYVGTHTTQIISSIDNLQRTDPKLIKVFKYPYCPIPHSKTGNIYTFDENWVYDLGLLKYNLDNLPELGSENIAYVGFGSIGSVVIPSISDDYDRNLEPKNINHESKLLHSDFYSMKIAYDSFFKELKLENVDMTLFGIDFKPTSTVNSKFGFKIKATYKREDEDYQQYLIVNRNNEETVLNSAYISYIQNGYNYDKKQNAIALEQATQDARLQTLQAIASIGFQAAMAVASGGASAAAGAAGSLLAASAKVGLAQSGVSSAFNALNSYKGIARVKQQQDNAMAQKLQDLMYQGSTIAGADDVDLLSWYSGNRLHKIVYDVPDNIKNKLYKELDENGYATDHEGTPDVYSRIWFNFIQCSPVIDFVGAKEIKDELVSDLKEKYGNGVLVVHHNDIDMAGTQEWDFERNHENYESWIKETF